MRKNRVIMLVLLVLVLALATVSISAAQSGEKVGVPGTATPSDVVRGPSGPTCFADGFEGAALAPWDVTDNGTNPDFYQGWVPSNDPLCVTPNGSLNMTNITGGSGNAACVSADLHGNGFATDTTMCGPAFSLSAATSADFSFLAAMENFGEGARLWATANGATVYDSGPNATLGVPFVSGELITVSLDAYAGNSSVELCFNHTAGWDWYVQVDDVQVTADIDDTECAAPTDVNLTSFDGGPDNTLLAIAFGSFTIVAFGAFMALRQRRENEI